MSTKGGQRRTEMTHALRETENYINACIRNMNQNIDYMKGKNDRDADYKRDWALKFIKDEFERGIGGLHLACIYLEEIDQEDMEKLNDKLLEEWYKAQDRVWEEIK